MSHRRTQIRDAVAALILAGSTSAGSRVFNSQLTPLWDTEFPAISVYARDEESSPLGISPTPLLRKLKITIEIRAQNNSDLDEELDDVALEVENLMIANPSIGGLVRALGLINTELSSEPQGEKAIGVSRLTYEVHYVN